VDRDRGIALLLPRLGATDRARGLAARRPLSRAVPGTARDDGGEGRTDGLVPAKRLPSAVGPKSVLAWNLAVLAAGIGFFYQDQSWSALLHGSGFTVLLALWGYYLLQIVEQWWSARTQTSSTRV